MGAIRFDVHTGVNTYEIAEEGGRHVASYFRGSDGKIAADDHVDHLNREHAEKRVAQAKCGNGHPCDRDRIHVPLRDFTMHDVVVLCDVHAAHVREAR